jgi:hypothetical protein
MKTFLFITCLLISSVQVFSQHTGDYFPQATQFTYQVTPLDSLNDPIISEEFRRRDLFAEVADYNGKLANIFLTKNTPIDSIDIQPYLDSLFFHLDGTDGYEYFQTRPLKDFLDSLDAMNIDPNFNFLDFFRSLEEWYKLYRFSSTVNDEYTLISVDTSVAGFNARFEYLGERFPDETIITGDGSFDCKKFLISWKVSVQIGIWIPIITTNDTVWIADQGSEFGMVQDIIPTNHINLSLLGIPPFSIPGLKTVLIDTVIVSAKDDEFIPIELALEQNYPNPFNPSTSIQYAVSIGQFVSLKVYDILGNEVAILVNSEKPSGVYVVEWNAANVPSGVYFYQLKTGSFVQTKKMLLLK